VGPLGRREDGQAGVKRRLHQQLLGALSALKTEPMKEHELREELGRLVGALAGEGGEVLAPAEQETLVEEVLDDFFGYGPIDGLMRDHDISDIVINGPRQVFIEKRGQLHGTEVTFLDENHLLQLVRRLIAGAGRRLDERARMVDVRLTDGSRLNAVMKPPALNGPLVSIRRFGARPLTVEDLLANESVPPEALEFLAACVRARVNLIISGGTGTGKTTLLNALSRYIPPTERVVTIEDTPELELQQPHVAKMQVQPPDEDGKGGVSIGELIVNSLRMRPDRIIVGECRGTEALDMLQAMNTGHEGSLSTIHANSARQAISRLELMIGLSGADIPVWAIRKLIATSVNLVVQVSRVPGGKRKVVTVSEIVGMEGDVVSMHELFEFVQTGVNPDQVVEGHFRATGIRPLCLKKLQSRGVRMPPELFMERRLEPRRNREAGR
jgi:pilus assembly protein CpaF